MAVDGGDCRFAPGEGPLAGGAPDPFAESYTGWKHASRHHAERDAMSAIIQGLGEARPGHCIEQSEAADVARTFVFGAREQTRSLPALFRRTQVHRRGSVLLEPPNGRGIRQSFYSASGERRRPRADDHPADATLCSRGLRRWHWRPPNRHWRPRGVAADRLTHLVTVSCTGFSAPGVDVALIKGLGLSPSIGRAHIGFMGCHGALNGLRVAQAFVEAEPTARVLLCAVELCSLHYQYGLNPEAMVANALFADGAAAAVVGGDDSDGGDRWRVVACKSFLIPDSEAGMTWPDRRPWVRDDAFGGCPRRDFAASASLAGALARGRWVFLWRRLPTWAIHPGGPRILSSVAAAMGLPGRRDRRVRPSLGRMRQHVVADDPFCAQSARPDRPPTALRGPGVWAGHHGRGRAASIIAGRPTRWSRFKTGSKPPSCPQPSPWPVCRDDNAPRI